MVLSLAAGNGCKLDLYVMSLNSLQNEGNGIVCRGRDARRVKRELKCIP
jgi:hypothetical protein